MLTRKNFVHRNLGRFFEIYLKMRRAQHHRLHRESVARFRTNTISWLHSGANA